MKKIPLPENTGYMKNKKLKHFYPTKLNCDHSNKEGQFIHYNLNLFKHQDIFQFLIHRAKLTGGL